MATTKEIKNRIKSVKDTQKITNAMYLISSTKMTRAKKDLENTRPYFDMLRKQISTMIMMSEDVKSGYFKDASSYIQQDNLKAIKSAVMGEFTNPNPEESEVPRLINEGEKSVSEETMGYLVITADKGLAGAYNQNVIKEAMRLIEDDNKYKLFVVGEYGRHYFEGRGIEIEESFLYTAQNPTLERAREITQVLTDRYSSGEIDKIYIIYTDFKNGLMGGDVNSTVILPFDRDDFVNDEDALPQTGFVPEYYPDVETVLDNIIPSYIMGYIYSALVDSFCSEQSARMSAMDAANQNAEDLLGRLNLEYNHVRQGAITQEITEVSAGSRGQKKSKKKRKAREEG